MKRTSLSLMLFLFSLPAMAGIIRVSGFGGIEYRLLCRNRARMTFDFHGVTPGTHVVSSRRPLAECQFTRLKKGDVWIDFSDDLNDGANALTTSARWKIPSNKQSDRIQFVWSFQSNGDKSRSLYE